MAPSATEVLVAALPYRLQEVPEKSVQTLQNEDPANFKNSLRGPLPYTGTLDEYEHLDLTAVIGREYPKLQLTDLLKDDVKLRDLAVLSSSTSLPNLAAPVIA